MCECADPSCTVRVPATLAQYESVRQKPTTFLLAPGHDEADIERVISEPARFEVVEKSQMVVRRIVTRLDPRRRSTPAEG